jgi:hypothetical protein
MGTIVSLTSHFAHSCKAYPGALNLYLCRAVLLAIFTSILNSPSAPGVVKIPPCLVSSSPKEVPRDGRTRKKSSIESVVRFVNLCSRLSALEPYA